MDVLLFINGARALVEAGWQIHPWLEGWSTQRETPFPNHTSLSPCGPQPHSTLRRKIILSSLSYWWSNSRPRGQSSFPVVTQEGSEQDPALPPSLPPAACSRRCWCLGNESQSRNEKSLVLTRFCIKKHAVSKDTLKSFSGPESIWPKFDRKKKKVVYLDDKILIFSWKKWKGVKWKLVCIYNVS